MLKLPKKTLAAVCLHVISIIGAANILLYFEWTRIHEKVYFIEITYSELYDVVIRYL